MQPVFFVRNIPTLYCFALCVLIFVSSAAAQNNISDPKKAEAITSSPSHDKKFYSLVGSVIKQSKRDSAIALLYGSKTFSQLKPDAFEDFRRLFLRVPPNKIYPIAKRRYKLRKEEVDALRTLMGINISTTIKDLGYSTDELESLNKFTLNGTGIGELKLGMSIHEASEKLGIDIWSSPYQYGSSDCRSYALGDTRNNWVIRFIVENEKIMKIDVFNSAIPTDTGIKVGDSASRIMELYPKSYDWGYAHEASMGTITVHLSNDTEYEFTVDHVVFDDKTHAWQRSPSDEIRSMSVGFTGTGTVEGCL